jgi:hypothetical protein
VRLCLVSSSAAGSAQRFEKIRDRMRCKWGITNEVVARTTRENGLRELIELRDG